MSVQLSKSGVAPDTTSIYAAVVGGASGIRVLHSGGDESNYGLTVETDKTTAGEPYYQAYGRYTLFVPERTAVARLHGVTLTV